MGIPINGRSPGSREFNPSRRCFGGVRFGVTPGASDLEVLRGVALVMAKLEDEMKAFVPTRWRHRVRFYRVMPRGGMDGRLGWEYRP